LGQLEWVVPDISMASKLRKEHKHMAKQVRFSAEFWRDVTSIKVPKPQRTREIEALRALRDGLAGHHNDLLAQEALGDVVNQPPPSGDNANSQPGGGADNDQETGETQDKVTGGGPEEPGVEGGDEMGGDPGMGEGGETGEVGGDEPGPAEPEEPSVLDPELKRPGKHPFADVNGRELLSNKIRELAGGVADAIEMVGKVPKVRSVVINDLMELQDEVSRLGEIVYMVDLEATMVRYRLCVRSYNAQVKSLVNQINNIISEENE
jgi:hypothetical protein